MKTYYNSRTWLNPEDSPSTGSVVCYDGYDEKEDWRTMFVSVSDCYYTARLHKTTNDTQEDFINKCRKFRDELTKFIEHLEKVI